MDHVAALDMTAGRRDEEIDRIVAVLGQREELGHGLPSGLVVDRAREEDVAALEEERVDTRAPLLALVALLLAVVVFVVQAFSWHVFPQ